MATPPDEEDDMDEKATNHAEMRMALVFRGDLDSMTRGKSEGQAAHAAFELAVMLMMSDPAKARAYLDGGQPKIVVETPDMTGLEKVVARAQARGVPLVIITDQGRTCFPEPTTTCALIGPMSKTDSNAVTRGTRMRG